MKKNARKTQYRFLETVWYDRHDDKSYTIYQVGSIVALDWSLEEIQSALVCGLVEEVIDDNST